MITYSPFPELTSPLSFVTTIELNQNHATCFVTLYIAVSSSRGVDPTS